MCQACNDDNFICISVPISDNRQSDYFLFHKIINRGIDSRLTGFIKSKFNGFYSIDNLQSSGRLYMQFHIDEIEILLRRLNAISDSDNDLWELAYTWESDILESIYGIELV